MNNAFRPKKPTLPPATPMSGPIDPQFQTPYGTAFATGGGQKWGIGGFPRPISPNPSPAMNTSQGVGGFVGGFPRTSTPTATPQARMPGGFPPSITPSTPTAGVNLKTGDEIINLSQPQDDPYTLSLNQNTEFLQQPQFQQPNQPQTSAYGGAQNSTQRWQQAAQQGSGYRQMSPQRVFNNMTGLIDGRAPYSSRDTTPSANMARSGMNPDQQWSNQFKQKSKWAPY